jgi:ABC-2 type transport system permease protein
MNGYWAIMKMRMKVLLQYRAAAGAAMIAQIFWGILMTMILRSFYASVSNPEPITLSQSITFIWLGQSLLQLLPWTIDKEIESQIKNGNVAYELIRPLDLYASWFVRSMAMRLIPTLMRCIPIFVIASWCFGLEPPVSWNAGCIFCISIICAIFLASAITTLVLISLFWTISGEGIQRLLPHLSLFLSGVSIPLPLFPQWMQFFMNVQPFRGIMDIPCRIYTGVISQDYAWFYVGFQIAWIIALVWIGQNLIRRATRHFVIQGG